MLLLRCVVLTAVAASALACTRADVLRLDNTPRPQTTPESIQLLGQEPTRPYAVIAIVSAQTSYSVPGSFAVSHARSRLLKEAARLGGEAVLLDNSSVTEVGGDDNHMKQLTGKVIVFTDTPRTN